ncbi:hypothetical protein [Coralloluteibacterium stylophorae]|uniref:Uncharacterized protein n=1 Tax=Coralloluteibacterium stylophorae TaxID=1776034 RepID=A0A8J8AZS0_9GAMM|nr:hypothetical protein [Coralloluteibacterium stylophorae]MBS7455712.1 hypothetical protein [Coralloluteibacterium stylophorae]
MSDALDAWQAQWPLLFRALADPDVAMPSPGNGGLEQACASWGALHHALRCLLGWEDVGRGLAWWYAAGRPVVDSPVLALVERVWGRDDLLDYYAAWAWKPEDVGWLRPQSTDPTHHPSPSWLAQHAIWRDEDWWRAFLRRGAVRRHDPFYGGSDPLHLSAHGGDEGAAPSPRARLMLQPGEHRAVLVAGELATWHADLHSAGQALPSLGERSWRVDVFDRLGGWLGEYRRSRVSGRWFTGRHAVHMQGIPGR